MKKNIIIITAIIFLLILVLLVIFSRLNRPGESISADKLTPTLVLPTRTLPSSPRVTQVPQPIISQILPQLPFDTQQFLVEYLPKSAVFYVTIYPPDFTQNYQAALVWLEANQIPSPDNNSQVRFRYLEHR